MMRIVSEHEFRVQLELTLDDHPDRHVFGSVTGPGRSGAVAAVYASHYLGIPFIPYGQRGLHPVLVIDTARESGKTLRKAQRKYDTPHVIAIYEEPPRVAFWYEAPKPQRYRHEARAA